jgi:tetratricopeptide (TPR) repeat protein
MGLSPALCPLMLARGELSTCLMLLGKFEASARINREDCAVLEKLGKDASYASALGRLADMIRLSGDLQEADCLSQEAVAVAESCYDRIDHTADGYQQLLNDATIALVGEVLYGRASLMETFERYQEAKQLRERALNLINKNFGQKESLFTTYGMMLGETYLKLEQYDKAAPLIMAALETRRKQLPKNHMLLISGENKLGRLYCLQGRLDEAEPLLVSASKVTKKWNADYGEYLADVARLRSKQGKPIALKLFDQALSKHEQLFGKDNPVLLPVLEDYAAALQSAGDSIRSSILKERATSIRQRFKIDGRKDS